VIALEMSLRGLLRSFRLKVGAISRGRYNMRVRDFVEGNAMLEAATTLPMLKSRAALRVELADLEGEGRGFAQDDLVCRLLMTMHSPMPLGPLAFHRLIIGAVVALTF